MDYSIKIIHSSRKILALEIKTPGLLIVRAPMKMSDKRICEFIDSKEEWIVNHMEDLEQRLRKVNNNVPKVDIRKLRLEAERVVPRLVNKYADIMNVNYGRITIRCQRTRWGSCSSKGNLNFNCLLMLAPDEVLEYVVVHELAHRVYMDHSEKFWGLVGDIMPDYNDYRVWLRVNGGTLIQKYQKF